ncbi:MAG TPA: HNH endonuclease [Ignavibacteria bacterium]|jgi:5-methylcytosine-specific restriction endonuclease McrA
MRFILNQYNKNCPDRVLIADLKKTAAKNGQGSITYTRYNELGRFSAMTLLKRFGSWNNALEKAGLKINHRNTIGTNELFENMKRIWLKLQRQPSLEDMKKPESEFTGSTYVNRFGTWRAALKAFVKYTGTDKKRIRKKSPRKSRSSPLQKVRRRKRRRKSRHVSKSLRFDIMKRDHFKCRVCGRSPATDPRIILHVDHKTPHSKEGLTDPKNLWTLCSDCNYGKGTKTMSS